MSQHNQNNTTTPDINNMAEETSIESDHSSALVFDTISSDESEKQDKGMRIVGVGASAGGLEALQLMVSNLPTDSDLAFVVAQHLSPSYKSMMVDLLEKDATIRVCAPKNHEVIKPNTIYICPPNYNIEVTNSDQILLTTYVENTHTPRPSVDLLLESIAIAKGENAIGIVLSGTGTDGARGIRAIKGEGGFSIAQDPNTAKYDGMPNSAINSGSVDLILAPEEIGIELKNLLKFSRRRSIQVEPLLSREAYNTILRKLKREYKVDFALYKESTIVRRIERRMTALKLASIEAYLKYIKENNSEISFLFNDMLIGVTAFFRDARAFETLHSELKHYLHQKDNNILRVWIPGCSTGEEAYTIAIIVAEILGEEIEKYKIQIFATDIDKRAIDFARSGVYPESALQKMPKLYRQKYFTLAQDQYEIIKPLKAHVIFSEHDVTNDPPFLRLDLISCRNLLIYFNLELQRQIMPVFHYALNPKGLLYLGQSESIGVFQEQFRAVSKSAKLYESVFLGKKVPPERASYKRTILDYVETPKIEQKKVVQKRSKVGDLANLISETLKTIFVPYSILINENMDIVYVEGKNPLLIRPEGVPSNNIYTNLHPGLLVDLRSCIHLVETGKDFAKTGFQKIEINDEEKWVRIMVSEIPHLPGFGRLLMLFCQVEDEIDMPLLSHTDDMGNVLLAKEQERQLMRTKEQLQSVIEELETSNEEMQSMNEELQSSNEELQSSNEELETTNEELQSTNEELQTAYAELRVAYEDKEIQQRELNELQVRVEEANNLLQEAEKLGGMGSWMWDVSQHLMTWSHGCYELFGLDDKTFKPSYEAFIGLAYAEDRNELEKHITALLTHQTSESYRFRAMGKNKNVIWVELDAFVSFNKFRQAEKVIGNLTNITNQVQLSEHLNVQQYRIDYLMQQSLNGAYIYDYIDNKNIYINPAYTKILGYTLEDMNNCKPEDFVALFHPDDVESIYKHMDTVKNGTMGVAYPIKYRLKHKYTGEFVTLYSNDTIYAQDTVSHKAITMLGTFFEVNE